MNKTAAIPQQMLLQASRYYQPSKWQHVLDVLQKAQELKGKQLTDVQQASILWHDSAKKDKGPLNHARNGAQIAKRQLKSYFSPEDIKRVSIAIKQHNLDQRIKDPATFEQKIKHFASPQAQLLAIADDARPSDPQITWKKTLSYNIKGQPTDKTPAQLYRHMKLRLDPRKRMPQLKYYKDAFSKDNAAFIKWLDNLTQQEVENKISQYKKRSLQKTAARLPNISAVRKNFASLTQKHIKSNRAKALLSKSTKIPTFDRQGQSTVINALNDIRSATDIKSLKDIARSYNNIIDIEDTVKSLEPLNLNKQFYKGRTLLEKALLAPFEDYKIKPIASSVKNVVRPGERILGLTYKDALNRPHMILDDNIIPNPYRVESQHLLPIIKAQADAAIGKGIYLPISPQAKKRSSIYVAYPKDAAEYRLFVDRIAKYNQLKEMYKEQKDVYPVYNIIYGMPYKGKLPEGFEIEGPFTDNVISFTGHSKRGFSEYPGTSIIVPEASGAYNLQDTMGNFNPYLEARKKLPVILDNLDFAERSHMINDVPGMIFAKSTGLPRIYNSKTLKLENDIY